MTHVVGQVFDSFARYNSLQLLQSVSNSSLQLLALGFSSLFLSSITSLIWISTAELNLLSLRKSLYQSVLSSKHPPNPASHISNFAKETDDIRAASSLASAFLIQHLTTAIASLILAFLRSYSLTLVILSSLPILVLLQFISQSFASPLLAQERAFSSKAASQVDAALSAIDTVKAFNAQHIELSRAMNSFTALQRNSANLSRLWGLTSASVQFVMMSMFVQAFWYGAKLVRDHKNSPGDIMAVFWACLIATSNLQMCMPRWIVYSKGKFAMADMLSHINPTTTTTDNDLPPSPTSKRTRTLRKISPSRCIGELALHDVSFSYSDSQTLSSLSLFLPANELTFLIGSSGSGKSTVAQLLLGFQSPQPGNGHVTIDEQDLRFLDESWLRENVMLLGQGIGAPGAPDNADQSAGTASYGAYILLPNRSIFDNVALALSPDPSTVPFHRVVEACRAAMLHEFVIDLPQGYDTILGSGEEKGSGGIQLSGGQKQRLMLARARLRNPPVLILDEATSALDPPTRILVFSALRRWRTNKTTIVITHDLSQVEPQDFVYVLKAGKVVEQGFRGDLEEAVDYDQEEEEGGKGEFRRMMASQQGRAAFEPAVVQQRQPEEVVECPSSPPLKHQSILPLRPLTFGNWNWMLDAVAELTKPSTLAPAPLPSPTDTTTTGLTVPELAYLPPGMTKKRRTLTARLSRLALPFASQQSQTLPQTHARPPRPPLPPLQVEPHGKRRPSSAMFPSTPLTIDTFTGPFSPLSSKSRRFSAPMQTPTSATFTVVDREWEGDNYNNKDKVGWWDIDLEEAEFEKEKTAVTRSGTVVHEKRRNMSRDGGGRAVRKRCAVDVLLDSEMDKKTSGGDERQQQARVPSFFETTARTLPLIPCKRLFGFALVLCTLSGLMTPVFSYLLSRLLFEVSLGGTNTAVINRFGGLLLLVCAFDGALLGSKYTLLEIVSMRWATRLRRRALGRVLAQDRAWFDGGSGQTPTTTTTTTTQGVVQTLVKDAEDARGLIGSVYGQMFVVSTMVGTGLVWAMVLGWELTLAGLAIGPVFAVVMGLQARWAGRAEARSKCAREGVCEAYYDALKDVRGVRALGGCGFRKAYEARFEESVERAMRAGVKGAFVEGSGFGVANGMIYFAEAGLFYVGALLIERGVFGYLRMVEVLNLVVFSVSIGAQLMVFTEKIAKSTQAAASILAISSLPTENTSESKGTLRPPHLSFPIQFSNVSFAYPSRPSQPVLRNLNLRIEPGEVVAIVGASGCGKSTVISLVQRLWEPSGGNIWIGDERGDDVVVGLDEVDVRWLRDKQAVVSQGATLFDTSVAENIRYGSVACAETSSEGSTTTNVVSDVEVRRAAKRANVHEVVMGLGAGYDTVLGSSGGGLSGGQAQRVQIARALARMRGGDDDDDDDDDALVVGRGADVLMLDEGTSALDGENEGVVLDAVRELVGESGRGRRRRRRRPTVVMVTHKIEVMRLCDRLVVLGSGREAGRVVEEGRFEELMERKGEFARLASGGVWEC